MKFIERVLHEVENESEIHKAVIKHFGLESNYKFLNQNFLILQCFALSTVLPERKNESTEIKQMRDIRNAVSHDDFELKEDGFRIKTQNKIYSFSQLQLLLDHYFKKTLLE